MGSSVSQKYPWEAPYSEGMVGESQDRGLRLLNTLTGTKVPFFPSGRDGQAERRNTVRWYICGPTVYDSAHLGHARTYVAFDIVRRVMEDYFGYEMLVQMGVTDIDDKIIKRSNEQGISSSELARKYEAEFMEDMRILGCRKPTYVTRVTEYVGDIVAYIARIVENGFAYESNGSVYFSVDKFVEAGHNYAKLKPSAAGNESLLQEGEGDLSVAEASEKRSSSDFALWKRSKPGEPVWPSPWGEGRPGWHIECSVMVSSIFGETLDIHAGGVDLQFPHHDNELAQSESYFKKDQWINYFLHSGHLHIDGLKMSKSLKNFITIREVTKRYNANQLRIMFLKQKYEAPMSYSENAMGQAVAIERMFANFFASTVALLREEPPDTKWRPADRDSELIGLLGEKKAEIHAAFQDNINTPLVLEALTTLVQKCNSYMNSKEANGFVVRSVARYITYILKVMGLSASDEIGFESDSSNAVSGKTQDILDCLSAFRDQVKRLARESGETSSTLATQLLDACDDLRDDRLPPLGVRLEDRASGVAVVKLDDPETVMREIARKRQEQEAKRLESERRAAELAAREQAELELGRIPPSGMFKLAPHDAQYSAWDEEGLPTLTSDGSEVSKSQRKKLAKERERQKKRHEKYLASLSAEQ
mmetsp:Transcript_38296/g.93860  ORF Transcript_38296/g.93860 Transcript_38296/m.93860 type:complete len:648 (-) Transcript_38296:154-2097(-)